MEKDKPIRLLIDLRPADVALLDSVKDSLRLSSRGQVVSTLLQAAISLYPPAIEMKRQPARQLAQVEKEPA